MLKSGKRPDASATGDVMPFGMLKQFSSEECLGGLSLYQDTSVPETG